MNAAHVLLLTGTSGAWIELDAVARGDAGDDGIFGSEVVNDDHPDLAIIAASVLQRWAVRMLGP